MKAALLIVLSLSALAYAGPAFNKNNQIDVDNKLTGQGWNKQQQQQQQYMTSGEIKSTQAVETLKQWCFASQMSQPELTASFKKLVGVVKSQPEDQNTEIAVMSERICQGTIVQKAQNGETLAANGADAQAHELIKDVYMDALIACETRQCKQQLVKIIDSQKVDSIRASYYMTRIAVTEKDSIKDDVEIKQLAESIISGISTTTSEAIERQKLFAVTSLIGKALKGNKHTESVKQTAEQIVRTIVERYIKPVSQSEVQQYQQQQPRDQSEQLIKKIAKRSAALKALVNIPGYVLKEVAGVEQTLVELSQNKNEMVTVRQSAIECLEQNDQVIQTLKQLTFDQEEPIEVRVAALRALVSSIYAPQSAKKQLDEQTKEKMTAQIVEQIVKHCDEQGNQEQDDQFVLYAISYLDNLRTSQQPEHEAVKQCISKNKQHYMQIQLLNKKFKQQLGDIRKYSRNYKLEQEFNQIESGLIIEGDLIYESQHNQLHKSQSPIALPKMIRVNMSMPVMGETVNVVEITVRQNQMDEELLGALKMVQSAKFNSQSVGKVVDSFKSSVEQRTSKQQQQQQQNVEADLTIKVDGCTIVYVSVDDFKTSQHQRNTRSVSSYSIVDEIIEHLKRKPVAFNRGFNFNVNERLAKVLDVDANVIAGLRFESRASGQSSRDYEIQTQVEPRLAIEAIVGPAKLSAKKLMQRFSTKTALGLRLRFKSDELVDVQLDLPLNIMELFTFETQMVEKSTTVPHSYTYLPESIYGQEDIYTPDEEFIGNRRGMNLDNIDNMDMAYGNQKRALYRRSIFGTEKKSKSLEKFLTGKRQFARSVETPEEIARATGLRTKLRVVASPKDMSFLVQAVCQKYEPEMQGYRFQIQKVQRGSEQKQFVVTMSTPGSRLDRTIQVRVQQQYTNQRYVIKTDCQSPMVSFTGLYELIHDGRQYAIKTELVSTRGSQWRHSFECGLQRSSQSQSARVATTYKPYMSLESTSLRRPIQMQGVVSYQQMPKTVISYELKCPTTGDFVQGKLIVDQRTPSGFVSKRTTGPFRRSMQSPIEQLLEQDTTITGEYLAQVSEHVFKIHEMFDWDASKQALNYDYSVAHKNLRKSHEASQMSLSLKLDKEQQVFNVQRKCPQQQRKEFNLQVVSDLRNGHQFVAECRYNGPRQSIVAYKHKVELLKQQSSSLKQLELNYQVELIASEQRINEKFTGRTQVDFERKMKTLKTEMYSRTKSAKLDVEYVSMDEHKVALALQGERVQHRTTVRCDQRQYQLQSRTESRNQLIGKLTVDVAKQQQECQIVFEYPIENWRVGADLKLASGKISSLAIQTPRFATKAEFTFDKLNHGARFLGKRNNSWMMMPVQALRFKTDLKDSLNQENYWIESAFNADPSIKSYLRFDSPVYRTDVEFQPREQLTKFGMFARSKRSINSPLYSLEDALTQVDFHNQASPMKLAGNKLWMLRSFVQSPFMSTGKVEELKEKARRALFEYADRRQQHKHVIDWSPMDERVKFAFERTPMNGDIVLDSTSSSSSSLDFQPMRLTGDLATNYFNDYYYTAQPYTGRPSKLSMESELIDFDFDTKPFDGSESYAKINAVSRHRRSPFKKHESEVRFNKQHGYKAWMKHEDAEERHHSAQLEADKSPKKWAKIQYDSDKHGKVDYEHKWRKEMSKRASDHEDVFWNKVHFAHESPKHQQRNSNNWMHQTRFEWEEPAKMFHQRERRDISDQIVVGSEAQRRYNTYDYLKHLEARLDSQTSKNQRQLYKVDFDYKPLAEQQLARLSVHLPEEMLHESSFEYEPTEKLYKVHSKYMNLATKQPHYELMASTKPVLGLATADQEPVFIDEHHPMLNQLYNTNTNAYTNSIVRQLFKQPLKLDYSDKYGRLAHLDYDQSPMALVAADKYQGLRQKRAALYFKDDSMDFEHESSFDFYPEALINGGFKQIVGAKRPSIFGQSLNMKASTKYGPVAMKVDSSDQTVELQLESPVVRGKLTCETSKRGAQLIKVQLDNKQQTVQLAKIIRKQVPVLRDSEIVQKIAEKLDQSRFEHQGELLVSVVDAILKVKSQTKIDQRSVLEIDGEYNKQADKAFVKINGERTNGQLVVDLVQKSAQLVLDVDDKRTLQHQTRLVRVNNKFYSLDSMTTYEGKPVCKLSGKVSAMVFSDPAHLFARRGERVYSNELEHVSTFEAVIYEPKQVHVSGQYDCLKKEARVVFRNTEEQRVQETVVKYDEQNENILVNARLSSRYGQIYATQAKINLPGLVQEQRCVSRPQWCQSELVYTEQSGDFYSAKYAPGQYVSINTPHGKQNIKLVY